MKKEFKKVLSLILLLALCVGSVNAPRVQAEEPSGNVSEPQIISVYEENALVQKEEQEQPEEQEQKEGQEQQEEQEQKEEQEQQEEQNQQKNAWDGTSMESVYEGENFKVRFTLFSFWEGGYNADITIENTGDTAIENWSLKFPFQDKISNIWNAVIEQNLNGIYIVKNADWNQDIPVSGSVKFGFSTSNDFTGFPVEYEVLMQKSEKKDRDYSVEYSLNSDWGAGFTGSISITNNTNRRLEDWVLEFDFVRDINSTWDAEIISRENNHYVIRNAGHNANISAGQKVSFGFTGQGGGSADEPSGFRLYSYETDTTADSDGDGLTDEMEITLGLNPYSEDSDEDGLTDYEEIHITLTDPLKTDTNGNGIIDSEDDMDGEGISNRDEIDLGTDPLKSDTDGDNLTDYEEVYVYGTDPLVEDTDSDGLTDYDDIVLGFSPLLADTDGNGIIDSEEQIYQTVTEQLEDAKKEGVTGVSVSLTIKGNAEKSVAIGDVYGIDILSSDVVGLVGVPVEIYCSAEFEQAEITFYYDTDALGDTKEEDLSVMWYDEENDWYQILDEDSVVDIQNHTVSYITTHFSTYMLVDSTLWYDAWRENIDYRNSASGDTEKNYFDITFVFDISISMGWDNRMATAKKAVNNFIDSMQDDDEAAIVTFCYYAYLNSDFTHDKGKLKQIINGLSVKSGTDVNAGLLKAIQTFEKHKCNKQNIIVLICDGDVKYAQSTIAKCIDNGIQIYAVNVLNDSVHESLEGMASQTGGQYYYASSTSMLETIFVTIAGDTTGQIDHTDTDNDGLYDIYETAGIKMSNGRIIHTNPQKQDSDGDGLTDYQETGIVYELDNRYIGKGHTKGITYVRLRSDPTKEDTDDDGLTDDVDDRPLMDDTGVVVKLDNKFPGLDYLHIEDNDGLIYHGGHQGWWEDKSKYQEDSSFIGNLMKCMEDKYYRLWQLGCGTIAMSDAEMYMAFQNDGYNLRYPIIYDENTGACTKEEYRDYIEKMYDNVYEIDSNIVDCVAGLTPWNMEVELSGFLKVNGNACTNVTWARYEDKGQVSQKTGVLYDITKMLKNNIPVVFAYYDSNKDEIKLYNTLEEAKNKVGSPDPVNSHYMTVIGLYKFVDTDVVDYKYILEVVSWGKIYYIDYNEYADKLGVFSNILSVY